MVKQKQSFRKPAAEGLDPQHCQTGAQTKPAVAEKGFCRDFSIWRSRRAIEIVLLHSLTAGFVPGLSVIKSYPMNNWCLKGLLISEWPYTGRGWGQRNDSTMLVRGSEDTMKVVPLHCTTLE